MPLQFQKVDASSKQQQKEIQQKVRNSIKSTKSNFETRVRKAKKLNSVEEISALDLFKVAYRTKNEIVICFEFYTYNQKDVISLSKDGEFGIKYDIDNKRYLLYHYLTPIDFTKNFLEELTFLTCSFEIFEYSYANDPKGERNVLFELESKIIKIAREKINKAKQKNIEEADKIIKKYNSWALEDEDDINLEENLEDDDTKIETITNVDSEEVVDINIINTDEVKEDGLFSNIINKERPKEYKDVRQSEISQQPKLQEEKATLQKSPFTKVTDRKAETPRSYNNGEKGTEVSGQSGYRLAFQKKG